jgi:hypothetical protein
MDVSQIYSDNKIALQTVARHDAHGENTSFTPISISELSNPRQNIPEELILIGRKLCRPDKYSSQDLLEQARAFSQEHNLDWWTVLNMLNKTSGKRIAD